MNEYFKAMSKARKSGAKTFAYAGGTYVRGKTKTGMVIYKKKGGATKKTDKMEKVAKKGAKATAKKVVKSMTGKTKAKAKATKTEEIKIEGEEPIKFKKGTLRRSLGLGKRADALTKEELKRLDNLKVGVMFDFRGKKKKLTKLMKKRIGLAITLMDMK